jgi:hydroxymethylpyrimidine/phosphomethylpyrimidine kinase
MGVAADAIDLLDDGQVTIFRSEWIEAPNVRGTGCMLSSAIAAQLANGSDLKDAVTTAKQFVSDRIQNRNSRINN